MGFLRTLRGLFDEKSALTDTLQIQEETYHKLKRQSPGCDEHEYLARVWLSRAQSRGLNPYTSETQTLAWSETFEFACLEPPYNIRALAIRVLMEEVPAQIMMKYPTIKDDYEYMMAPIEGAKEDGRREDIYQLYRKHNPKHAHKAHDWF